LCGCPTTHFSAIHQVAEEMKRKAEEEEAAKAAAGL
jgi:hypothetical protein